MKLPRRQLLVDPPAASSSDIAFILIIFFLVCASVQPETGMAQTLPRTEEKQDSKQQSRNLEVSITPTSIVLNGSPLNLDEFRRRLAAALDDLGLAKCVGFGANCIGLGRGNFLLALLLDLEEGVEGRLDVKRHGDVER